jgi:hypothetical protein
VARSVENFERRSPSGISSPSSTWTLT